MNPDHVIPLSELDLCENNTRNTTSRYSFSHKLALTLQYRLHAYSCTGTWLHLHRLTCTKYL